MHLTILPTLGFTSRKIKRHTPSLLKLPVLFILLAFVNSAVGSERSVFLQVKIDARKFLDLSVDEVTTIPGPGGQPLYLPKFELSRPISPTEPIRIVSEEGRNYVRRKIDGVEYELGFTDDFGVGRSQRSTAWTSKLRSQPLIFSRGSKIATRIDARYYELNLSADPADRFGRRNVVWDLDNGVELIFKSANREITTRFDGNTVIDAGSPEAAAAYYERISGDVGFNFIDSTMDEFIAYMLYPDGAPKPLPTVLSRDLETMISLSDFQRGPDSPTLPDPLPAGMIDTSTLKSAIGRELWNLQSNGAIQTATFFAPKIVNYAKQRPYDAGWRKMVYLAAQPGSRAKANKMSGAYILFNYAGNNKEDPANKDPLKTADQLHHAISGNNQIILMPDFDTASGGRPFTSGEVDTAYFAVYGPFKQFDRAYLEQKCFSKVQGKVPWYQNGSTRWGAQNVKNLCNGTIDPDSTIACFNSEIATHNNWAQGVDTCSNNGAKQALEKVCFNKVQNKVAWNQAGSTAWYPGNVTALCENTAEPDATIACFTALIAKHNNWGLGIRTCKARERTGTGSVAIDNLQAGFDIDDGAATLSRYYVPNGCANCHGHDQYDAGGIGPNKIFPYVKPNYIDTDNLYQAMRQDFKNLLPGDFSEPLLVNKRQLSRFSQIELPEYRARFDVLRDLNQQMKDEGEFARRTPVAEALALALEGKNNDLYQFGGADMWLDLHNARKGTRAYDPVELPTVRGYGYTTVDNRQIAWKRDDPDHVNLLNKLDQYCFRCHSTIKFSAFDLNSVGRYKDAIISHVETAYMPPGRTIPQADRDCIVGTLKSLTDNGNFLCLQPGQ